MLNTFQPLPVFPVKPGAGFCAPEQPVPERVSLDDPALSVMTDLARVSAVVIRPNDTIDEALARTMQRGVRSLLVIVRERRVRGRGVGHSHPSRVQLRQWGKGAAGGWLRVCRRHPAHRATDAASAVRSPTRISAAGSCAWNRRRTAARLLTA